MPAPAPTSTQYESRSPEFWIECLGATWEGEERSLSASPEVPWALLNHHRPTTGLFAARLVRDVPALNLHRPLPSLSTAPRIMDRHWLFQRRFRAAALSGSWPKIRGWPEGNATARKPLGAPSAPTQGAGGCSCVGEGCVWVWPQGIVVETRTLAVCGERSAATLAAMRFCFQRHQSGQLPESGGTIVYSPTTPPSPALPRVPPIGSPLDSFDVLVLPPRPRPLSHSEILSEPPANRPPGNAEGPKFDTEDGEELWSNLWDFAPESTRHGPPFEGHLNLASLQALKPLQQGHQGVAGLGAPLISQPWGSQVRVGMSSPVLPDEPQTWFSHFNPGLLKVDVFLFPATWIVDEAKEGLRRTCPL